MTWLELEEKFASLLPGLDGMRLDIQSGDLGEHLRLAAWHDSRLRRRFESLARIGGDMIIQNGGLGIAEVDSEMDPLARWFRALWKFGGFAKPGPFPFGYEDAENGRRYAYQHVVEHVVDVSRNICFEFSRLSSEVEAKPLSLFVDDVDSFSQVRVVSPSQVSQTLDHNGRVNLKEAEIKAALEQILDVRFRQVDWGGELNDLYSTNVRVGGKRLETAFMLKGRGKRSKELRIADCGKNGDQIVRLFRSPATLFVVQYVGRISQEVVEDVSGKTRQIRAEGKEAQYMIVDGQDTARLLYAYGKLGGMTNGAESGSIRG